MAPSELLGWAAAALTVLTFYCRDMVRLRLFGLLANIAFVSYGLSAGLAPVLVLHLALIPINLTRLLRDRRGPLLMATGDTAPLTNCPPAGIGHAMGRMALEHRAARVSQGGRTSTLRGPREKLRGRVTRAAVLAAAARAQADQATFRNMQAPDVGVQPAQKRSSKIGPLPGQMLDVRPLARSYAGMKKAPSR